VTGADDSDLPLEIIDLEPVSPSRPPREPRSSTTGIRGRKLPIVVAIVVIVGLVVSVVAGRSSHPDRATAATSTTNARTTRIDLRGDGQLFAARVGAQLLTAGSNGLALVDTDTGGITTPTIPGLPIGPLRIITHSGATVVVSLGAYLYWFTLPHGVAHRVDATTAFPAAEPGHVWLATDKFATEVPGDTDRLPRSRVATKYAAIGAVNGGLLEQVPGGPFDDGDAGPVVVQPVDGHRTVRALLPRRSTVIGVHADRVAWVTHDCGVLQCPVHISETAAGADGSSTWFQLPGHPSDLALHGATAFFSPAGDRLAVVLPDNSVTSATTLVLGDLRTRTTTVVNTTGYLSAPGEATGLTVDWTRDGNFVVIAPELGTGAGRLGAIDPANGRILASRVSRDGDTSVAATGTSTLGALDLPRRLQPIAKSPSAGYAQPGHHLVGADREQVDILDLGSGAERSVSSNAVVPNPAGPFSLARVTGGWLVVRNGIVSLIRDDAPAGRSEFVDAGTQVLSARDGRKAWIALGGGESGGPWRVSSYDPATGARGTPHEFSGTLDGAVDDGVVFTRDVGPNVEIAVMDDAGRVRAVHSEYSASLKVLATGGEMVAYFDEAAMHLVDVTTGQRRTLGVGTVTAAALSPDGRQIAFAAANGTVYTTNAAQWMQTGTADFPEVHTTADRLLVTDDGTVLYTSGVGVWQLHVGDATARHVEQLSVDPSSELALD